VEPVAEPKPKEAHHNAGAFLGPDLMAPVPMRTLSDEYHDGPAEPEDSDRVPPPEFPGWVRRLRDQLAAMAKRR
jgi:hypothetical protein